MRVNKFVYAALVLVTFLGIINLAQAFGWWATSGKFTPDGERITVTGTDPDEIKGWMTLQEVATAYKIPLEEICNHFNLPADIDPNTQLKDMEGMGEDFSPRALREWLKER
ncbi:MAG: hypothetical protein H0Z35_01855 [Thermoanaerobacteraceae bacterium]|nr:hypothetical protein [Thermoanaerobacteraceae bacterium]